MIDLRRLLTGVFPSTLLLGLVLCLTASPLSAGDSIRVTINGEVEFNGIGSPPLSVPVVGEAFDGSPESSTARAALSM